MSESVKRAQPADRVRRVVIAVGLALSCVLVPRLPASASIDTSACDITLQVFGTWCLGPRIPYPSVQNEFCSTFSNGKDYETATDAAGVPQEWTFSNGTHPCIEIDYFPGPEPGQECHYWMYVPDDGYANANVYIGWWNHDNTTKGYAAMLPESTTAGWVELNMKAPGIGDGGAKDVSELQFRDNNGQTGTYIGWGADEYHGIKQVC